MNLRDESINAGVGRGQGILQGQRNRRGIIEAHVHPVDTEVGARILRRSGDIDLLSPRKLLRELRT